MKGRGATGLLVVDSAEDMVDPDDVDSEKFRRYIKRKSKKHVRPA